MYSSHVGHATTSRDKGKGKDTSGRSARHHRHDRDNPDHGTRPYVPPPFPYDGNQTTPYGESEHAPVDDTQQQYPDWSPNDPEPEYTQYPQQYQPPTNWPGAAPASDEYSDSRQYYPHDPRHPHFDEGYSYSRDQLPQDPSATTSANAEECATTDHEPIDSSRTTTSGKRHRSKRASSSSKSRTDSYQQQQQQQQPYSNPTSGIPEENYHADAQAQTSADEDLVRAMNDVHVSQDLPDQSWDTEETPAEDANSRYDYFQANSGPSHSYNPEEPTSTNYLQPEDAYRDGDGGHHGGYTLSESQELDPHEDIPIMTLANDDGTVTLDVGFLPDSGNKLGHMVTVDVVYRLGFGDKDFQGKGRSSEYYPVGAKRPKPTLGSMKLLHWKPGDNEYSWALFHVVTRTVPGYDVLLSPNTKKSKSAPVVAASIASKRRMTKEEREEQEREREEQERRAREAEAERRRRREEAKRKKSSNR